MNEVIDRLSQRDFDKLASLIQGYCGIKMPPTKKTMVEGRLRRRMRATGAGSLSDYCRYLFDEGGLDEEMVGLIDAVTTNKTDFFREPEHFRYLADEAVPTLLGARRFADGQPLKIWSAAASIGAEAYTIAMVMTELKRSYPNLRASILGTDICSEALSTGVNAIYPETMIAPVPLEYRQRYLLRSTQGVRDRVRIIPELRRMVSFLRLNLMETPYDVAVDMHVIFCRNILIYFDKTTQRKVLTQLCEHLRPGGFLFLGHSETLTGFGLPLRPIAATIFRRT